MAESTAGGSMADRARLRVGTRSRRSLAKFVVGVAFWAWVVLRWLNDWAGGLVVPRQQPFVPPSLFTGLANAVPDVVPFVAGALRSVAFAVEFLPALVDAFWLTIVLTGVATVLGFFIAVPLAGARVYGRLSAWLALGYVELFRGTPLLAQLFVLYYGLPWLPAFFRELPLVGAGFVPGQAVFVAILGFTLNSAAYQAEYIRGAVESVDPGQLLAARSVGLSRIQGIRFVVFPQALRYAIPGWTNELVYLIKYSSLAAFITVPELFQAAQGIASTNYRYTALFVLSGLLYLALVVTATTLMEYVGDVVSVPGVSGTGSR